MSIPHLPVRAASPGSHQANAVVPADVSPHDTGLDIRPHHPAPDKPALDAGVLDDRALDDPAEGGHRDISPGDAELSKDLTGALTDETAMRLALDEAHAALSHDDVPVGAVVTHHGSVIAARHNERELTGDPTAHAEVLAMRDAAAAVGNWRLDECTMFVTLEPCAMCAGAMVNSRLGRLVYGATDPKAGAAGSRFDLIDSPLLNHRVPRLTGVLAGECGRILVEFFATKRKK